MLSMSQLSLPAKALHKVRTEGVALARKLQQPVLTSFTCPVPWSPTTELLSFGASRQLEHQVWSVPMREFTLVGLGEAHAIEGRGVERFDHTSRLWNDVLSRAVIGDGEAVEGTGPILMGGFSFDPQKTPTPLWDGYPDARLVLPRYVFTMHGTNAWLTFNKMVTADGPEAIDDDTAFWNAWHRFVPEAGTNVSWPSLQLDVPDPRQWLNDVRAVAAMLHEPEVSSVAMRNTAVLEKVVLARTATVYADRAFVLPQTLAHLQHAYPDCFIFDFQSNSTHFIGATPERLVRLTGGNLETTCLAGSIGRGENEEQDVALGEQLLRDAKERREHWLVLQAMRHDLADVCQNMTHGDEPTLLKLTNVQHLYTPIRATCRPGYTVFDVLARLHPTPAVGGSPRALALPIIRARESFDRGWYASPIGWLDARGDGEFAVALRSAVVKGRQATLFAGCGIMPTSDPVREYDESRLKLQPMLSALGGGR